MFFTRLHSKFASSFCLSSTIIYKNIPINNKQRKFNVKAPIGAETFDLFYGRRVKMGISNFSIINEKKFLFTRIMED